MGVHAVADRVSSLPPSRSVRHEQPIAHAYPLGGSLYASSGHSLSTTGKYEPAGRRFFECALHPGILCSRRALFGLGRSLSVHIRTQRHPGQTPGKTTRFLKCTEPRASRRVGQLVMTPLLTRGRPWQVLTRQWVVAPRRSRAPPARRPVSAEVELSDAATWICASTGTSRSTPTGLLRCRTESLPSQLG